MSQFSALPKLPLPAPRSRLRLVHSSPALPAFYTPENHGIHLVPPSAHTPRPTRQTLFQYLLHTLLSHLPTL